MADAALGAVPAGLNLNNARFLLRSRSFCCGSLRSLQAFLRPLSWKMGASAMLWGRLKTLGITIFLA